jgi:radical SAM protein with 4Fe4S-binding SPASM domain
VASTIPTIPGNILRDRILRRARAERIPIQAEIEIIATCNFNCVHCYIAPCAERGDMMSVENAKLILDKLERAGTLTVLLTGGEVLTHRGFREIYIHAKRKGFSVFINTNAYMIGEKWADFFAEWPSEAISISLYGLSNESYEKLTGVPNAFDKVSRAIDLLLERNVRIGLKCPAMTMTSAELPAMKAFAEAKGVKFRTDYNILPQEKGGTQPLQLQLSPRASIELMKRMEPSLGDLRTYVDARIKTPPDDKVYLCGAGRTGLAINVFGGVTTCLSSRKVVANLIEQSFDEVWEILGGKVAVRYPDGHPCGTCKFKAICAGCPATVESLTGLPEGYVQQYCAMTHLRAHELGYHPTGVPRTVTEGIPSHVRTPQRATSRVLPLAMS